MVKKNPDAAGYPVPLLSLPETNNGEKSICREKAIGKQISVVGAKCFSALLTLHKYGDKIVAVNEKKRKKNTL